MPIGISTLHNARRLAATHFTLSLWQPGNTSSMGFPSVTAQSSLYMPTNRWLSAGHLHKLLLMVAIELPEVVSPDLLIHVTGCAAANALALHYCPAAWVRLHRVAYSWLAKLVGGRHHHSGGGPPLLSLPQAWR